MWGDMFIQLSYFPDMEAHKQGRDVVLVSNEDVWAALWKVCEHDSDIEAVHMAKEANVVQREMFNIRQRFNGSLDVQCQLHCWP